MAPEIKNLQWAYYLLRKHDRDRHEPHHFDLHSLLGQSYVHCWRCGQNTNFDGPRKQRHPWYFDVHHNWLFLPWHRAYLYFHERILAMLLEKHRGVRDFALPYWDWDTEGRNKFPEIYERGWTPFAD
jgi:polyphenol oxidase